MDDMTVDFRGHELNVIIESYNTGKPAKTWGLPENCYPEEPEEIEFSINSGNQLLDELIEESEDAMSEVEEAILDKIHLGFCYN